MLAHHPTLKGKGKLLSEKNISNTKKKKSHNHNIKELLQSKKKKADNPVEKWTKDSNRHIINKRYPSGR